MSPAWSRHSCAAPLPSPTRNRCGSSTRASSNRIDSSESSESRCDHPPGRRRALRDERRLNRPFNPSLQLDKAHIGAGGDAGIAPCAGARTGRCRRGTSSPEENSRMARALNPGDQPEDDDFFIGRPRSRARPSPASTAGVVGTLIGRTSRGQLLPQQRRLLQPRQQVRRVAIDSHTPRAAQVGFRKAAAEHADAAHAEPARRDGVPR